jgi:hypothetical protein
MPLYAWSPHASVGTSKIGRRNSGSKQYEAWQIVAIMMEPAKFLAAKANANAVNLHVIVYPRGGNTEEKGAA